MKMIEKIRAASHAEDPTYDSEILQSVLFGTLHEEELHYFSANASTALQNRLIEVAALMDCTFLGDEKPPRFNDFEDATLATYNQAKANRSWADQGARECAKYALPGVVLSEWAHTCYRGMFDTQAPTSYRIGKFTSFLATLGHLNTEDYMEALEEVHRMGIRIHVKYILRSVLGLD